MATSTPTSENNGAICGCWGNSHGNDSGVLRKVVLHESSTLYYQVLWIMVKFDTAGKNLQITASLLLYQRSRHANLHQQGTTARAMGYNRILNESNRRRLVRGVHHA